MVIHLYTDNTDSRCAPDYTLLMGYDTFTFCIYTRRHAMHVARDLAETNNPTAVVFKISCSAESLRSLFRDACRTPNLTRVEASLPIQFVLSDCTFSVTPAYLG